MTGRPRLRRLPPWGVDALLAAGVAVVLSIVISADQAAEQRAEAPAYLWAVGLGALMLVRRRYPRLVLVVTALGLFAYYAIGYPAIGLAVPVAAALFSAAEAGRLAAAIGAAVAVSAVSAFFRLTEGQDPAYVLAYDLVGHVALMTAAIALGDSLRSRRAVQAGERELAEVYAEQAARESERRAHAERLAIARDLHDSLGHSASVISLHADVAREMLAGDAPDHGAATNALDLIRQAATGTLRELRRTVALLRTPTEPAGDGASVRDLATLSGAAQAAGIEPVTDVRVPEALPAAVDAAAYRILQEAVTNVVRHSDARRVGIEVYADGDRLHVTVTDDGTDDGTGDRTDDGTDGASGGASGGASDGASGSGRAGHGIAGMRERARALGGSLTAERASAGFAVRAELPLAAPGPAGSLPEDPPREGPHRGEPS